MTDLIGLHGQYALVPPQTFVARLTDEWTTTYHNVPSAALRAMWTTMANTYQDAILDTAAGVSPRWRILCPASTALPPDQRTRFVAQRQKLSASIGRLENAELSEISSRLDKNADSLKDGIASLRREIDSVERTVAIVNAVGTVAGFAARVAGLTG